MVSYHPHPRPSLRARLRLALHDSGGEHFNRLVHHERGRYLRRTRRLPRPLLGELREPDRARDMELSAKQCWHEPLARTLARIHGVRTPLARLHEVSADRVRVSTGPGNAAACFFTRFRKPRQKRVAGPCRVSELSPATHTARAHMRVKVSTVARMPCSSGVRGISNQGSGSCGGNGSGSSSKVMSALGTVVVIVATISAIDASGPPRLNTFAPSGGCRAAAMKARATSAT